MEVKGYDYSDIYLIPQYSDLTSRADADVSVNFLGRKFKSPVLSSNMASVISEDNAKWLSENDLFYIMHRFGDNRKFLQRARTEAWKLVSISVGVKQEDKEFIKDIAASKCRVDYITIDTAHGHSSLTKEMIAFIKKTLVDEKWSIDDQRLSYGERPLNTPKIIAGNVCTSEAVNDLASWGADAAKCGIAGGAACITKSTTGFHVPMFTCIKDCSYSNVYNNPRYPHGLSEHPSKSPIPILADGGIREKGDIAKALVAGASMVMIGSMIAACVDAPGENIYCMDTNGPENYVSPSGERLRGMRGQLIKKRYWGSASAENKQKTGQEVKNIEGISVEIPCNGKTYAQLYEEFKQALQSSCSYAGKKNLEWFSTVQYGVKN